MPTTSSRMLTLLSLLQSRRDWPGGVLAERLDVSTRTVRRDVDRLRELGYRIATVKGPDGGYRLDAGADLPPLLFDDDQAVALTVALQVATTAGAGIGDHALRALGTLRQVMPTRLRHRIDALTVEAVRPPGSSDDADPAVLVAVGTAVRAREVLRFDYGVDAERRRAEPHHVVTWRGRWYLVAFDLDRDDWRTFRVDRIAPRTPNGPRFTPRELPGGDVATYLTGVFRGNADGVGWPCTGEVVVGLPLAEVLPYVGDGVAVALDDGRTRLTVGSWSWAGGVASVLRYDAEIEVVGPDALREAFARVGERCGRAGRGTSGGAAGT
ncbi:MAG: WYL domain-containing protein [Nocardioides alkalitolerans]